jgi:hypothetical protein
MNDCGHTRHVGTCAACQRAQLARWRAQLREASSQARVSKVRHRPPGPEWRLVGLAPGGIGPAVIASRVERWP